LLSLKIIIGLQGWILRKARTFYSSLIETTALNSCSFEKIAFFSKNALKKKPLLHWEKQANRQINEETGSIIA